LLPKLNEAALKEAVVDTGGAALTVTASVTLCVSEVDEPWIAMLAVPFAAVGLAVTVICCSEPGAMDRVIGEAVTPEGREPTATITFPLKPFTGEAVIAIACAGPPGVSVTAEGVVSKVKSAEPPPPHPVKTASSEIAHRKVVRGCIRSAPKVFATVLFLSCK
jgi:hypothetical protein